MLSANIVRKHFPADISPACSDGHGPLLNSLETRADGPPLHYPRLRPYGPCGVAAIGKTDGHELSPSGSPAQSGPNSNFWVCGLVPSTCGIQTSGVCLQTIYGLNSGVFLSTLLHMPYPDRGVVWRSVQSVFTRLFTRLFLCSP